MADLTAVYHVGINSHVPLGGFCGLQVTINSLLLDCSEILSLFHFKELHGASQGLMLYLSQAEGSALQRQSVSCVVNRCAFKDVCGIIQHNNKETEWRLLIISY